MSGRPRPSEGQEQPIGTGAGIKDPDARNARSCASEGVQDDPWALDPDWDPLTPTPPVRRTCRQCGEGFDAPGSEQAARRYCGGECARLADLDRRTVIRRARQGR